VANWDVAAASLILKEAGGVVTRLNGSPVDFTGADKFSLCAAGSPRLHRELLSALA
jgi:fructose-1,6-bisphosphatase/inositol monophosphatase family enzyme